MLLIILAYVASPDRFKKWVQKITGLIGQKLFHRVHVQPLAVFFFQKYHLSFKVKIAGPFSEVLIECSENRAFDRDLNEGVSCHLLYE